MKKILVVDDDPMVLEVSSKLIKFLGLEYIKARNYEEALTFAIDRNVIMAIIDILTDNESEMLDFLLNLKKRNSNLILVISTGHLNHPFIKEYKKYGFTEVIKKPYGINELRDLLKKYT